jgi:glutamate/tyrosine decarboxylase-like PLP-dependent enzyme
VWRIKGEKTGPAIAMQFEVEKASHEDLGMDILMSQPQHASKLQNGERREKCESGDRALKSLFLGPQSENANWFLLKVNEVLRHTFDWRRTRFPSDGAAISKDDMKDESFELMRSRLDGALQLLLNSLENETPKFTPRYIGHMVSEISLPSLLAEFAMLLHNPNNASREASKVGLAIEKEAIQDLAAMIGFDPAFARGHFTSGGTIANFEGLWRALYHLDKRCSLTLAAISRGDASADRFFELSHREIPSRASALSENDSSLYSFLETGAWGSPANEILGFNFRGPVLIVPSNKHYSWPKAAAVFGLGARSLWQVSLDRDGRLDVDDLQAKIVRAKLEQRPIVAVVSVAGTTELGEVDDVGKVQDVLDEYARRGLHIWHHVDAAYGGFLCSVQEPRGSFSLRTVSAMKAIARADSVTLDPHKLGYVPYACGAIVTRNQSLYRCRRVAAPYLEESEDTPVDWATTLEGSRSAAGASAVWLSARTLPFSAEGFGRIMYKTIEAKEAFFQSLNSVTGIKVVTPSDTNILCFALARPNDSIATLNGRTRRLYEFIEQGPDFSVSRTRLGRASYDKMINRLCHEWEIADDQVSDLFVIRLVLMNPFIISKEMNTDFEIAFKLMLEAFLIDEQKV